MHESMHLIADGDNEVPVRLLVFVVVFIIWGIKALIAMSKRTTESEKARLQQVRESIARSVSDAVQPPPARPPVALAPEIARRIPPVTSMTPPRIARPNPAPAMRQAVQKPKPARPALVTVPGNRRRLKDAAEMKRMATIQTARQTAPPQLRGKAEVHTDLPRTQFKPESATPSPTSSARKSVTVNATVIKKWLTPATLRQQFILTELFQPPLSMREKHL